MFSKVLVANRGEIAVRVMRALTEMGIASVAVYSEVDRDAPHVRRADESYLLGPGPATESYLRVEKILEVAAQSGAEAVHPGYGFLAENAAFAKACEKAGLVFIGPPPAAIEAMGSKTKAREMMQKAGVPIVPGTTKAIKTKAEARKAAAEIGYPVAAKAAGGGGGKGFRVAMSEDELEEAIEGAGREGEKFFSDPTVYLERYLEDPRHVEVQVLADGHGNVVHLGERDCSVQRRHQKLIEETPAPGVDAEFRERIGKIATDAAEAIGYRSAGTIEGLLARHEDGEPEYFFLEMNTRVQVEHTVTEMATGIDIVREQIRIAAGEPISFTQEDVEIRGSSIECRINAEAAHKKFAPAPGAITTYVPPAGPGVRVDSGVEAGSEISPMYDPMVAKLVVWDSDREAATARMLRALGEFEIGGLTTLIPFHKALLATKQWRRGETCRDLVEDPEVAQEPGPRAASRPVGGRRGGGRQGRARLHSRGGQPPLLREGDRPTARRRRRRSCQLGRAEARPATRARGRWRRRRRQRGAHLTASGHRPEGEREEGRGGRVRRPRLRHRGDEDGERDHRPPRRQGRGAERERGRSDWGRGHDCSHQIVGESAVGSLQNP